MENGSVWLKFFFEHLWMPFVGLLAYLWKAKDTEMKELQREFIGHRLDVANNYVKRSDIIAIAQSVQRIETKQDQYTKDMYEKMAEVVKLVKT